MHTPASETPGGTVAREHAAEAGSPSPALAPSPYITVAELVVKLLTLPQDAPLTCSFYPNDCNQEPVNGAMLRPNGQVEIV